MSQFSILINTCDKFEDCWDPFFKLWSLYWPDCKCKIYLNTEYKDYYYEGLNIIPTKVCETHHVPKSERATWSQCLKWALEAIDSDIVLYMQEDYFLINNVKNDWVNFFFDLMIKSPEIPCIQLTNAGIPAVHKSKYEMLYTSDSDFFSYVSCQASLWRKDIMLSLIREHETAWNFEWWGSKRAKYLGYEFLTIDNEFLKVNDYIFSYILTGVVGGKWHKGVVPLFENYSISMNFQLRGFYENVKPDFLKKIATKISIWKLKSIIEIWGMRILSKRK